MGPGHLVCPKWVEKGYVGTLMNLHEANYFNEHIGEVHGVMTVGAQSYGGTVIVLNLGLHDNLDAAYLMKEVYGPVIEEAKARGTVRVICMALPAPDEDLKPPEFRENQGRRAVLEFNEKMRRFCRDRSVETMELYAPSLNASSYDGTHFALRTNALFGQLFLNLLAQGGGWEAAVRVLGDGVLV